MGSRTQTWSGQSQRREQPKKSYPKAESPRHYSWSDWKDVLKRVKVAIEEDHVGIISAGVAYYAMLAMIPLLIAIVSIYGLFTNPASLEEQITGMTELIPQEAALIIQQQLHDIVVNSSAALGLSAVVGIIVALASAAKGMRAIIESFNIAYNEEETRGMFRLQAQAILLTLGAALTIVLAIALIAVLPVVLEIVGLGEQATNILRFGRWPLLAVVFICGLAVIHRYAPDRENPKWRWVSVGSVFSTTLMLIASALFAFYANTFGEYNKTYGSLAGIMVLLLWFYIISYALILGAELNAELEHQTVADSTTGPEKPMGERNAHMADHVPSDE